MSRLKHLRKRFEKIKTENCKNEAGQLDTGTIP